MLAPGLFRPSQLVLLLVLWLAILLHFYDIKLGLSRTSFLLTPVSVRARRLPHSEETTIRCRASSFGVVGAGWIVYTESAEDGKAASDWIECAGDYGVDCVWEGFLGCEMIALWGQCTEGKHEKDRVWR